MIFCPKRLQDFFDREVVWDFLVPGGCVFFPERFSDFFVQRGCVIFFVERLRDFFVPRGSVISFSPKRMHNYFLSQKVT